MLLCGWSCEPLAYTNCFLGAVLTADVLSLLLQEITEPARSLCNDTGKEGLSFLSSKVQSPDSYWGRFQSL